MKRQYLLRKGCEKSATSFVIAAILMIAALLTTEPSIAQDPKASSEQKPNKSRTGANAMRFAAGKTSSGWLNFEFYAGNRILIPVVVNGMPVVAVLDSGASSTVLDRAFTSKLGLIIEGDLKGGAVGGPVAYGVVPGVDIQIGDLRWAGAAVAIDLADTAKRLGLPLPVILGGEIFKETVVEIDFTRQRIAFHNPASFNAPSRAQAAPLTPAFENQTIPVFVDGRKATVLLDLGNAGTLDLYPRFWDRSDFIKGRKNSTSFGGGAGGTRETKVSLVSQLGVGGAIFHQVPVTLCCGKEPLANFEAGLDGNLGMGVLSRFHLTIDFPHKRVLFEPPIDGITPFTINHVGLTTRGEKRGWLILHVAEKSPAALAGLAPGNVIVSLNGAPVDETKRKGWQNGPVGTIVSMRLSDGREVKLTRAAYF